MKRILTAAVVLLVMVAAAGPALAGPGAVPGRASGQTMVAQYPRCPVGTAWQCKCVPIGGETRTFNNPRYQGFRLDWCWTWAHHCGHRTANEFCRRNGYRRAVNWKAPLIEISPTKMMGSGQLCTIGRCGSFEWITCVK